MADLYRKSEINEMKKCRRVAYSATKEPCDLHFCKATGLLTIYLTVIKFISMLQFLLYPDPVSYTHLDVYKRLRQMLEELNIPFTEDVGEAAFYGPKVDINAKNVYGKEDTMITIQWDALLAEQFDMYYIDENGDKKRPCIIHRTSMGCYERTLAWLIEKYAGMFPTWLCPEQVRVIPISEKFNAYADKVEAQMKEAGIRCSVDRRSEKMGYKIREARLERVPYMLVVGAKEEEEGKVSVRSRYLGDEGMKDLGEFIAAIKEEIKNKTIRKIEVEEEKK